jgi:predicted MFS family arabinose efflux permease
MIADTRALAPPLSRERTRQAFLFGGFLVVLMNFSSPAAGMIDIPVTFFLKNRMHLQANELAVFKLWIGVPLFLGFIFGFIRDRWSPFGAGDRAHLMMFGVTTALIYGAMSVVNPTYSAFLIGLFVATMAFRMVSSAAYGITNTIAQKHAVSGQMSSVISIASGLPDLLSFIGGGLLSQSLEGEGAAAAARILFFCAAGLMIAIAVMGLLGPKWVFEEARQEVSQINILHDLRRIVRHWPIYPAMLIQLLWQFSPATGTVLQYHIVDNLHATDTQWGLWQGIFFGSFIPIYAAYALLSRRFRLRPLLWFGFTLAVFQMCPLLFVDDAVGALIAAAPMGLIGGLAQAALVDLTIRSAPRGSQGTMMMLFYALYYLSIRVGDLVGAWIYDKHGGFTPAVVGTIIVYALILPVILLVPKHLTATKDGEAIEV